MSKKKSKKIVNTQPKRKVIDCFPFFSEFMMLDIRLKELYNVVDKFVIVEAAETFTGIPKPFYLSECIDERYPQYKHKIEIITVGRIDEVSNEFPEWGKSFVIPGTESNWNREAYQKSHLNREALAHLNLNDDDIILVGDADEIPRRDTIAFLKKNPGLRGNFSYRHYHFKFNQQIGDWAQACFTPYKKFVNFIDERYGNHERILLKDSGWHFSFFFDAKGIQTKMKAFSHAEMFKNEFEDEDFVQKRIDSGKDMFDRPEYPVTITPIDSSYPKYVQENATKLKEWIKRPIGIILPFRHGGTASRVEQLIESVQSWCQQTEGLSDLYIIVDEDEPITHPVFLNAYSDIKWLTASLGLTLMQKINHYALDIAEKHDYIQFMDHDAVFRTPWESKVIDFLSSIPAGMAYGNDTIHGQRLATHPCITSNMIKAVGFYGCPTVEHNYGLDNYWMDISRSLGFIKYFPNIVIEHNHPIVGKAPKDPISERVAGLLESDRQEYISYITNNFANDVQKIKDCYAN